MYDALYPSGIPAGTAPDILIAAYVDNTDNPHSIDQAIARFPRNKIVTISSHANAPAMILDVERGAVDPTDKRTIRNWIAKQRAAGGNPIIYCNTSTWPSVKALFDGVPTPQWWAAEWGNSQVIPLGAVGLQWTGKPGYDISVMEDYIAGIDPNPTPTEDDVQTTDPVPVPGSEPISAGSAWGATSFYTEETVQQLETLNTKMDKLIELLTPPAK